VQQVRDVDDAVAYKRVQEHAHQPHQPVLHILVLHARARAAGNIIHKEQGKRKHHRAGTAGRFMQGLRATSSTGNAGNTVHQARHTKEGGKQPTVSKILQHY